MDNIPLLLNLAPEILSIIRNDLDINTHTMLARSCKPFNAAIYPQILTMVKNKLINPQFGQTIMAEYLFNQIKVWDSGKPDDSNRRVITKWALPLLDYGLTMDTVCDIFLATIRHDDFDTLRVLILLVSPRNIVIPCRRVKIEIRQQLYAIAGINKNSLIFNYPLFFLQIFGAKKELIDKVMELLVQISSLSYLLFQRITLGRSNVGIYRHNPGQVYSTPGTLSNAVEQHSPDIYDRFIAICETNDWQYSNLTIPESCVLGSLVAY